MRSQNKDLEKGNNSDTKRTHQQTDQQIKTTCVNILIQRRQNKGQKKKWKNQLNYAQPNACTQANKYIYEQLTTIESKMCSSGAYFCSYLQLMFVLFCYCVVAVVFVIGLYVLVWYVLRYITEELKCNTTEH